MLYILAAALPVLAAVLIYAARRRSRELERLFAAPETAGAALRLSRPARRLRLCCLLAALAAALAAAARPYWRSQERRVTGRGRDIVVVFDVSKSMLARDLPPSRLEHAKFLLRQLARKCAGDRLALIAFAGEAFAACPLTADPVAFDEYVDELKPELVPRGGTDLEKALREALKCLKGAAGSQAVVLVTDGDELTGSVKKVLPELEKRGIPLCVVGLGDPAAGAPLPDETGAPRRDKAGKLVTSRLNEPVLRELAAATGGVYVRSTVADTGADAVASRLAQLTAADGKEQRKILPEERFDWFVILSAALLLAALLIPERSRGALRAALWLPAAVLLLGAAEPPDAELAAAKTPEARYNLGLARQEKNDAAGARRCYETLLRRPDERGRARAKALLNLGVAEHRAAREEFAAARAAVAKQELDPALAKLAAAGRRLDAAAELYGAALAGPGAAALDADGAAAADLRSREADAERIAELKKRIEELKRAQQQARQSAQNARQQNRKPQDQKQQDQKPQDQKPQDQKQQDQKQQDRQNGQPPSSGGEVPREAIREAERRSDELRKQAESLGQKQLSEQAKRAAEELRRAESSPDRQSAQPHLERAVRELGADDRGDRRDAERQPERDKPRKASGGEPRPGEAPPPRPKSEPAPAPGAAKRDDPAKDRGTEQLLQLLNDEERRHRGELNRRRQFRRPEVERDW